MGCRISTQLTNARIDVCATDQRVYQLRIRESAYRQSAIGRVSTSSPSILLADVGDDGHPDDSSTAATETWRNEPTHLLRAAPAN